MACERFASVFAAEQDVQMYSVPGRTELGGNHTDHQHGRVLAAAVNRDSLAVAAKNRTDCIRIDSAGYGRVEISLKDTAPKAEEANTPAALVRGVAAYLQQAEYSVGGFDALVFSEISAGIGNFLFCLL